MGLKIQGVRAYNFGASGSNVTKLFHATCREARVFKWALFLVKARPLKLWRAKKTSKIQRDFWQLSSLIANISGTDPHIEQQKKTWSTTTPPTLDEKSLWTLVHKQKSYRPACWPTQIEFFDRLYFGPYGVLAPQIFTRARNWPRLASAHPGRPHVGLCPIFLVYNRTSATWNYENTNNVSIIIIDISHNDDDVCKISNGLLTNVEQTADGRWIQLTASTYI